MPGRGRALGEGAGPAVDVGHDLALEPLDQEDLVVPVHRVGAQPGVDLGKEPLRIRRRVSWLGGSPQPEPLCCVGQQPADALDLGWIVASLPCDCAIGFRSRNEVALIRRRADDVFAEPNQFPANVVEVEVVGGRLAFIDHCENVGGVNRRAERG